MTRGRPQIVVEGLGPCADLRAIESEDASGDNPSDDELYARNRHNAKYLDADDGPPPQPNDGRLWPEIDCWDVQPSFKYRWAMKERSVFTKD